MSDSLINRTVTVRQGAYLPHWSADGATYHAVFRLLNSLPMAVVDDYRIERLALLAEADTGNPATRERLDELFSTRIEHFLDRGHGACWPAQAGVAEAVANALQHFDGQRYRLHAWCVMPNHVHAVVQLGGELSLSATLHSWKSFTANAANRVLKRSGSFWQKESFDHLVRDAYELERTVQYVRENPIRAGLKNWRWVWP